jgi:thioesterase domain-containing protein
MNHAATADTVLPTPEQLRALERVLHTEIPLTQAMGVRVVRFDTHGLTLGAPLAPNLNHKHTAFGGSLAALATLSGWGMMQLLLAGFGRPVTVVIQENSIQYLQPVEQDFEATCALPDAAARDRFLRTLQRHGRARLALDAVIPAAGQDAVRFRGLYVASVSSTTDTGSA